MEFPNINGGLEISSIAAGNTVVLKPTKRQSLLWS
jgi:acyl-CoA reductase-like NAD-dependent aldehyde dehydrogenase